MAEDESTTEKPGRRIPTPLDVVVLTRDRLEEAIDDAVVRGRMTRDDGTKLLASLLDLGRRQTDDLISDVEQLLGRSREHVSKEFERARRAVGGAGAFPIEDYDELTAGQVTERLADLTPADLRKIRDYERRNANRKTVLQAVEQRLNS